MRPERSTPFLIVVALSCVFLAAGLGSTIGPTLARGDPPVADFTITALGTSESGGGAAQGAVLGVLYVDGRRVPLDSVERDPGWQLLTSGPSVEGIRSVLFFAGDGPPASLRVHGRHVLVGLGHSAKSGRVRLARDGGPERIVDCFEDGGALRYTWHELPRGTASWSGFGASFAILLLLAFGIRPWRSERRADLWIVLHASVAHLLVWLGQTIVVSDDSAGYEHTFRVCFSQGQTCYFPPGYPLFLELARLLPFGDGLGAKVTAMQAVLLVLCSVIVRRALRSIGPTVAFGAALLSCSSPVMLMMARAVMSEGLALFGVLGALYLTLRARDTGRRAPAMLAGAVGALSVVSRVTPLVVVAPFFLAHVLPWSQRRLRLFVWSIVTLVAVSSLPLLWFVAHGSRAEFANTSGVHVYNRVVFGGHLLDREAPATRRFLDLLGEGEDPFERDHTLTLRYIEAKGPLQAPALRDLMGRVAREAIAAFPFEYVAGSLWQAIYQCARAPAMNPTAWFSRPVEPLEDPPLLGVSEPAFDWFYALVAVEQALWPAVFGLALLGAAWVVLRHRRYGPLAILSIVPMIAVPEAFIEASYPRRSTMMVPSMLALAVIGAVWVGSALRSRRHQAVRPAAPKDPACEYATT